MVVWIPFPYKLAIAYFLIECSKEKILDDGHIVVSFFTLRMEIFQYIL